MRNVIAVVVCVLLVGCGRTRTMGELCDELVPAMTSYILKCDYGDVAITQAQRNEVEQSAMNGCCSGSACYKELSAHDESVADSCVNAYRTYPCSVNPISSCY